jgi:hypothetical protein
MIKPVVRPRVVSVFAAFALASVVAPASGCGSGGSAATAESGTYTSHLQTKDLDAQGVVTHDIGGGGIWTLKLTKTTAVWKGSLASNPEVRYPVVSSVKGRLTLGPNPECSTNAGRTQRTVFTVAKKDGRLAFKPVHIACKEDGGVLAAGSWKKS